MQPSTGAPPDSSASAVDKNRARALFARAARLRARAGEADIVSREAAARLADRLLDLALAPRAVLDFGCGEGDDCAFLRARYPRAELLALDFRPIESAQIAASGARFVCADGESPPLADDSVDLVWANLSLPWMDMRAAFSQLARILRVDGLLLFTAFGAQTMREWRLAAAAAEGENRRAHDFADMHDAGDLLTAAGFEQAVVESEKLVLRHSTAAAAARDFRLFGLGSARADAPKRMTSKRLWRRLAQGIEAAAPEVETTIEIVLAHAWRKAPAEAEESPLRFYRRG